MGREFAGILGLVAFSTTVLRGAFSGGADDALLTATIHLFAFAAAGWIIGSIAQHTVEQSVRARFEAEMKSVEEQSAAAKQSS
jgi:hypothetical protein